MLRAVIVGFGNIGHAVLEALLASADFEAAGVVSRSLAVGALGDTIAFLHLSLSER